MQKDRKFEKITDELETGFNFSRNKDRHIFLCITMLENMLLKDCFDATVRTKCLNTGKGHWKGCGKSWDFKIFKVPMK